MCCCVEFGNLSGGGRVAGFRRWAVQDPVCGMDVDESHASHRSIAQGLVYYFCSLRCKQKFDHHTKDYTALIATR
jgi:YHS domain-containing protein